MKAISIQIVSDIHGEFGAHAIPTSKELQTDADIVILAGDISRAPEAVDVAIEMFPNEQALILIAGNHEHYKTGLTIDEGIASMRKAAAAVPRVNILENDAVILNVRGVAVRFLGATFWTDFGLNNRRDGDIQVCQRFIIDHQAIDGDAGGRFLPGEAIRRHEVSASFLMGELGQSHDGPTVVVTHHLPSMRSVSKRFRGQAVSSAFASNADNLVSCGAALWVHGHTHDSQRWRDDSGTLVICNPAGYTRRDGIRENAAFQPDLRVRLVQTSDGSWRAE